MLGGQDSSEISRGSLPNIDLLQSKDSNLDMHKDKVMRETRRFRQLGLGQPDASQGQGHGAVINAVLLASAHQKKGHRSPLERKGESAAYQWY